MGYKKGIYRGSKNANAQLTEQDVRQVRRRLESGESAASMARDYFVSAETIRRIARGETWGWLGNEEMTKPEVPMPTADEIEASLARLSALGVKPTNG